MKYQKHRWLVVVAVAGVLAVARAQAAAPQVFSDNFTDGIWNGAMWKRATWDDGNFKEINGHVRFARKASNSEAYQVGGWSANFDRVYNGKDYLDVQALVRVPHKIKTADDYYEIGIGFYQSRSLHNWVELTVCDSLSNRQFGVCYYRGPTDVYRYGSFAAPTNINTFKLRINYSVATDKINFYWAPPSSSAWKKIRTPLVMKNLFKLNPPHTMRPYFVGYMEGAAVPAFWDVYLDNFMAVYGDVPL